MDIPKELSGRQVPGKWDISFKFLLMVNFGSKNKNAD